MRGARRTGLAGLTVLTLFLGSACSDSSSRVAVPDRQGAEKSAASVRAERRAFDGAPPVIAHENFSMTCIECHSAAGRHVQDVGFAPPSPHEATAGLSATSRCAQCHVFRLTEAVWRANDFVPLSQDLRAGRRAAAGAPPVLPHSPFMRENCAACHTGPAAREEVRTSHPERLRCRQCHVQRSITTEFSR